MPEIDDDDFLKKYHIEFPEPSALAVLHAEPVSLTVGGGYTFSAEAYELINELVAPSGLNGFQFNKWVASGDGPDHHRILFFLDRGYHMAHHIWGIRNSINEIAFTSYLGPKGHKTTLDNPPPVGLMYVADVATLTDLAEQSPFMGLLLPMADGPPDGAIWAYFLGKAEQVELDLEEFEEIDLP